MNLCNLLAPWMTLLGFIANSPLPVSSQYVHHHQHIYGMPGDNGLVDLQSQALTAVEENTADIASWSFVANFRNNAVTAPPSLGGHVRFVLTNLEPNLPETQAFNHVWSKTYLIPNSENVNLYAKDVYFDDRDGLKGYIICGRMTKGVPGSTTESTPVAFLFKTDAMGGPMYFKNYRGISELRSCVPTGVKNEKGYVAVGVTPTTGDEFSDGAYLSVDEELHLLCATKVRGFFGQGTGNLDKESGLNKVIQYGDDLFAAVGFSTREPRSCENRDTDVLSVIMDQRCQKVCGFTYGKGTAPKFHTHEVGYSIVELGRANGVYITGSVQKVERYCGNDRRPRVYFQDVLVARLKPDCTRVFSKRYNVGMKAWDTDTGLAIEVKDTAPHASKRIWVSGETRTRMFSDQTTNSPPSKDVFLLELKLGSALVSTDLFGAEKDDGGLYANTFRGLVAPGNLDLHLSRESYPIILGNTKSFEENSSRNKVYLIERYPEIKEKCHHLIPDSVRRGAHLPKHRVDLFRLPLLVGKEELEKRELELKEKVPCKKSKP